MSSSVPINLISIDWTEIALILMIATPPTWESKKDFFLNPKKNFWRKKCLCQKKIFHPKEFFDTKYYFEPKIFFDPIFFYPKLLINSFLTQKISEPKIEFLTRNKIWSKTFNTITNFCWWGVNLRQTNVKLEFLYWTF